MLETLKYLGLVILLITASGCSEQQPSNDADSPAIDSVTDAQMYYQMAEQLLIDIRIAMPVEHIAVQLEQLKRLSAALQQQQLQSYPGCKAYFAAYQDLFDPKQTYNTESLIALDNKVNDEVSFDEPVCFHLKELALYPARMQAQLAQPAQKWTQYRLLEPQAIALTYHWQQIYQPARD